MQSDVCPALAIPRLLCALLLLACLAPAALAQTGDPLEYRIGYLRTEGKKLALSVLDVSPKDEGLAGAKVAINDNNTTGKFLNQKFVLEDVVIGEGKDPMPEVERLAGAGFNYLVLDLPAEQVLRIADAVKERGILVFNSGATDDSLREENCRGNVFHTAPTRSMLADGLAQYFVWKQWRNWVLIEGSNPPDKLWAEAIKRAATRFGAKIVEERVFEDTGTARRTDTGQVQIQKQMPVFMQGLPDHDVVMTADESEVFGTYLPFRTWIPRPVAGSAGLVPSTWHPAHEQWGAMQIQNRFVKAIGRRMESKDMQAWIAVRIVGEAAQRTKSADLKVITDYIKSPDFSLAAFKGQKVTFRNWNWQLRQPILLSDNRSVVSVSPQEGFLHQVSELDTLGVDQPETKCSLQ
ncbi:MAG: ABC transporter substrate-binding protein [Parvibaculaceae bacterium]